MAEPPHDELVAAELVAVVMAVHDGAPRVLTTAGGRRLPAGPLQTEHRSMQAGLASWVARRTGYELGYVEQLYTFADRIQGVSPRLEISYLGLTSVEGDDGGWHDWYDYFPWEDRRENTSAVDDVLVPALRTWADSAAPQLRERRWQRCATTFGLEGHPWAPGMALQRYELLHEARLVPEGRGGLPAAAPGVPMDRDHRRILATGIGRLRGKIQYRPVVFELLPAEFTLGRLQDTVEAIAGQYLHKQNFRRLVEQQDLVEETGAVDHATGGRPAKTFRFRREVLDERETAGTKLPLPRTT